MLPKISLTEARSTQDDELARFREFVPQDIITKDYGISPPSEALSCNVLDSKPINSEDGIFLAGSSLVQTLPEVDLDPILEEIRAVYDAKPGWTTTVEEMPTPESPSKLVIMTSPENYQYFVRIATEPDQENVKDVSVSSFSPCFEIPADFDRFAQY